MICDTLIPSKPNICILFSINENWQHYFFFFFFVMGC